MAEQIQEAKDFDSIANTLLDEVGNDTQTESSTDNKQEDGQEKAEATGAEPEKTEQVKAIEKDTSLSVEEKIAKVKEILGDDEKAIDAYIKQKGYHNDPAWQKQRELIEKLKKEGTLSDEDKQALDEFKKYRSSPEYIKETMKSQGYTQDTIDKKLQESGFEVKPKPQDDVNLVVEKLGLNLDNMDSESKASVLANISDVSRIVDVIIQDRLNKVLPKELGPVKEHIDSMTKTDNASRLVSTMKESVKTEGILDFEKDIDPLLNKFMDENPDATQQDVFEHFKSINHSLTVERLKTGKKKEERDDKKSNLRQNIPFSGASKSPTKTGSFEKDADAFLDSVNV